MVVIADSGTPSAQTAGVTRTANTAALHHRDLRAAAHAQPQFVAAWAAPQSGKSPANSTDESPRRGPPSAKDRQLAAYVKQQHELERRRQAWCARVAHSPTHSNSTVSRPLFSSHTSYIASTGQ